ncbi:MAG: multiheme c-type cytochrome ExtKL [Thermodesulfovibrionales bacterium]
MRKVLICCLLLVVSLAITGTVQAEQMRRYVDAPVEVALVYPPGDICKTCHIDASRDWRASLHKGSLTANVEGFATYINSLETDPVKKARVEAGGLRPEMLKCFSCHAPMLEVASESLMRDIVNDIKTAARRDTYSGKMALRKLESYNVSCYTCHNLKAVPPPDGTDGSVFVYGPTAVGRSPFHGTKKGEYLADAGFCAQCHGVATAPDGEKLQCSTVSASYKDEYLAGGGKETCQDCHMRKAKRGHKTPGSDDPEMLKEGIGLNMNAQPVKGKKAADITVELVNNAGHRIPGSWMWTTKVVLELTAKDQQGKLLWSASKEYFKPKNQKGKAAKDTSLAIGKTQEKFRASLGKASGDVKLEANLTYVHAKADQKTLIHTAKQALKL